MITAILILDWLILGGYSLFPLVAIISHVNPNSPYYCEDVPGNIGIFLLTIALAVVFHILITRYLA